MLSAISSFINGNISPRDFMMLICVLTFVTLCCLPVHECAHAWMADKLGDSTGKLRGRINLSPMNHLSLVGTLMLFIFGFGYAKPVPVNIRNFKKRKLYFGLTALAGPVSNIIMAILFMLISKAIIAIAVFSNPNMSLNIISIASGFFYNVSFYNVALAVFNLIPMPPLDGSRILTMFLPDRIYYKILEYERYTIYILFALIFILGRLNISPITSISNFIFELINRVSSLIFGLG